MPLEHKTQKDRIDEIIELYHKLNRCGFPNKLEEILEFKKILNKWIKDGQYTKGRIKLPGWERIIHYELYTRKGTEIAVNLVYAKGL